MSRIVAISDYCDLVPPEPTRWRPEDFAAAWRRIPRPDPAPPPIAVTGGYLERLPAACVAAGLVTHAEVWRFCGRDDGPFDSREALLQEGAALAQDGPSGALIHRVFRADPPGAPYGSADARAHVAAFGQPEILCVWGLGVDRALLEACPDSLKIYNSIDAAAIRIPPEVSAAFDIFLTGAEWQSEEIRARHPDALCAVLPIGPDFASDITFRLLDLPRDYDVVYVAATQPYKRHDLLLDALERLPRGTRALCVAGYGHMTGELAMQAQARGLHVDWRGPVGHDEVNALVNRARVGVVCGVQDGAPAILTEYMLAGLPVLANAGLVCGLDYIRPETGLAAPEAEFAAALAHLIENHGNFTPRRVVQERWTWRHSVLRLASLIEQARARRAYKAAPRHEPG